MKHLTESIAEVADCTKRIHIEAINLWKDGDCFERHEIKLNQIIMSLKPKVLASERNEKTLPLKLKNIFQSIIAHKPS